MTTRIIKVVTEVSVTLDEDAFDNIFMEEFNSSFYEFDTIEEHYEHLAQLYARGLTDGTDFIEGYGMPDEMGIIFNSIDVIETEIID
jgi:hypothetical protein